MFRTLIVAVMLMFAGVVGAQGVPTASKPLTNGQKSTLKAAILAEPALAESVSNRIDSAIATYCNAAANPVQKAWRESMSAKEVFDATALTEYIARSAAERQGYDLLLTMSPVDASKAKVRAAVVDIFSGASNSTSRGAILNAMTESATWCEVKLGGTNATTDTVIAWRRNWTGVLTPDDISNLLN